MTTDEWIVRRENDAAGIPNGWGKPRSAFEALDDAFRQSLDAAEVIDILRDGGFVIAARASQPITATAIEAARQSFIDGYAARVVDDQDATPESVARLADRYIERISTRLADLPVREDEPTGIDAERLARAICASREPGIPATADLFVDDDCRRLARLVAAQYAELTREASHVR